MARALTLFCLALALFIQSLSAAPSPEGTSHVPAFDLPVSELLSEETQALLKKWAQEGVQAKNPCPKLAEEFKDEVHAAPCLLPGVERMRARYAVSIQPGTLGGVAVETITPAEGVSAAHRQQVLINLHGGAFLFGARWIGQIESIPIAAVGKYKVVSVDYRMAPRYRFPAASEDVEAVYRELLKTYAPQNIGIYGCSAGGVLTAQVTAWLQSKNLPTPGAIGMFCAAGTFWAEGDSGRLDAALFGFPLRVLDPKNNAYLKDVDLNDPLAYPARSAEVLAKFPPSLLITSTRDVALSSVAYTHSRLVALGVEAQLHVWEGLGHSFFSVSEFPESSEAYDVIARFFDRHLGRILSPR